MTAASVMPGATAIGAACGSLLSACLTLLHHYLLLDQACRALRSNAGILNKDDE